MYKSASKFQLSTNKPDRKTYPKKEEFLRALQSRLDNMAAYQLLVTKIKRRSFELRHLEHPSALCLAQSLDALPSLETVFMPSKHEMLSLSRDSIDNFLVQSAPEYTRYLMICSQVISACKKFQESIKINYLEALLDSKLPSIPKVIVKRFDAEALLKEIVISITDETRNKWPQWDS